MRTIVIDAERDVPRTAAEVWAVVADYARDPSWRAGVVAMEPTPPGLVRPGTTTREVLRFAGSTRRTEGIVDVVEPGRTFRWRTTRGVDAEGARTVIPLDGASCRVRLELTVRPRGVERLAAPVLKRLLARNLAGDTRRLAGSSG
ncbi:MAG: hypothetical protein AVDCRST_MAG50-1035 [uncultured Acidimicrobiales bacterium]|uniref:Polyketide cyclase/dehydrase n=1 Tax=uncultured Acidimicrobiales bacterium TaxID=310071 RepID=A0A6J4HNC8_9ACTN|nr:MAG: hypothetical protein AVDCRST_MAG50-1035 [uncultured Acidimicrobiales bacterium]